MLALAAMWLGVSVPLVIAGSYFGFRKGKYELSLKVNLIPRPVCYAFFAYHYHNLVAYYLIHVITLIDFLHIIYTYITSFLIYCNYDVQIPPQKWFSQLHVRVLLGGIVPFGAVFIEFFFIFNVCKMVGMRVCTHLLTLEVITIGINNISFYI